ncbi:MAG: hypothetical protein V2J07_05160 [Anaerolineae bacterium]|jgi:16S rRNA (guanine(1405)-N(7))-methyltransferase|nr:hypothetical protein [Anaerolineae bacterium]
MTTPDDLDPIINDILTSKKYRGLNIPRETVLSILHTEFERFQKRKPAIKSAKQKLHNIVAAYLGDPDYDQAIQSVMEIMAKKDPQQEKELCMHMLNYHASTQERLPQLEPFYETVFSITGKPSTILDLACGLHPFGIPWMNLPELAEYHAYDLHEPRTRLLQTYFDQHDWHGIAHHQDILIHPPSEQAEVAFLFKETHRMEKREKDCDVMLWDALQVQWLVVTLPAISLRQDHDLREKHTQLMEDLLKKTTSTWLRVDAEVNNELIFCLHKK